MTEKICDVKGCGKVSMAYSSLVQTEEKRSLIFFSREDWETKLFIRLCKDHYDRFWDSTLELLKGK